MDDPDLPMIRTDTEKLRHIADILITNAIEYTDSGAVTVNAKRIEIDRWTFRVEDTGLGIHQDDAKLLFGEFHLTGRRTHRGVGLGLVIARHLAHLMQGDITFERRQSNGSRFDLTLPTDLTDLAA